jgi:hypothetical protein
MKRVSPDRRRLRRRSFLIFSYFYPLPFFIRAVLPRKFLWRLKKKVAKQSPAYHLSWTCRRQGATDEGGVRVRDEFARWMP